MIYVYRSIILIHFLHIPKSFMTLDFVQFLKSTTNFPSILYFLNILLICLE